MKNKTKVALVFGGQSGEHSISCATAASIWQAIDPDVYEVLPIGITKTGQWVHPAGGPKDYELGDTADAEVLASPVSVSFVPGGAGLLDYVRDGQVIKQERVDVAFPVLHGPFGEDGTIQGLLEMADVPYVGCGVLASAVCMDKLATKLVLRGHGLPVGDYVGVHIDQWNRDPAPTVQAVEALGYPVFVKPARAGSSLGVAKANTPQELATAIIAAAQCDPKIIVEEFLSGREIECAVLEDGAGPQCSQLGELSFAPVEEEFYDFSTKYLGTGQLEMICPAQISPEMSLRMQDLARQAFLAVGAEGLARVDFFYDEATGQPVINEINTLPGFTPFSMYPFLWGKTGVSYGQLVHRLLQAALRRRLGLR